MQKYPSSLWFISAWILQNIIWVPTRLAFKYFLHLEVIGREHVSEAVRKSKKQGRGVLFTVNHTSDLDPILVTSAGFNFMSSLFPMLFAARPGNHYVDKKLYGWRTFFYRSEYFFQAWGAYPIIPGSRDYDVSLPLFVDFLKKGRSVTFFPEGRIKTEDARLEVRGGVGYLAEKADPLIIPVYIDGLFRIRNSGDFLRRARRATITFGAPYTMKDIVHDSSQTENHYRSISSAIMDKAYELKRSS